MIDEGERDKMIIIFNGRNFIEHADDIKQGNALQNFRKEAKKKFMLRQNSNPYLSQLTFEAIRWERVKYVCLA